MNCSGGTRYLQFTCSLLLFVRKVTEISQSILRILQNAGNGVKDLVSVLLHSKTIHNLIFIKKNTRDFFLWILMAWSWIFCQILIFPGFLGRVICQDFFAKDWELSSIQNGYWWINHLTRGTRARQYFAKTATQKLKAQVNFIQSQARRWLN